MLIISCDQMVPFIKPSFHANMIRYLNSSNLMTYLFQNESIKIGRQSFYLSFNFRFFIFSRTLNCKSKSGRKIKNDHEIKSQFKMNQFKSFSVFYCKTIDERYNRLFFCITLQPMTNKLKT